MYAIGGLKGGDDISGPEQVGNREGIACAVRRCPVRLLAEVGERVTLDQADDDFGHDATADRTEMVALGRHVGLSQDVEPQWRLLVEVEWRQVGQVGLREHRQLHGLGYPLTRRHLHGEVA